MGPKTIALLGGAAIAVSLSNVASAQDAERAESNRQAVRRMFPVVSLFDRKAAATTAAQATPPSALSDAGPRFGSSPADVARLRAMDVAGVRLGMAPEGARAALRAAGYSPTPDRPTWTDGRPKVERNYDYAARVEQVRRERLDDGGRAALTETIVGEDWNKGDERVHVAYVPLRDGVIVSGVLYTIPPGRIAWDGIKSSVVARYGRPTRLSENLHTVRYCGDGACAALGDGFAELGLADGWRLELSDGGALARLQARQAVEDAARSIRRTDRPSF